MCPGVVIAGALSFGETRDTEVVVVASWMRASDANLAAHITIWFSPMRKNGQHGLNFALTYR